METITGGGTLQGWLFFGTTVALFGWGIYLGLRAMAADHPPFREGGHTPGGVGALAPEAYRRPGYDAA